MNRATEFDRKMMQRCLTLARQALGRTSPNPLVGSVIVQEGIIIGEGFHPGRTTPCRSFRPETGSRKSPWCHFIRQS
jgi:diaminohydroxyphosphoribosylaminopyrimidine deaminase/5-amino-6-(5-phosphoribosylamino)uracil reductase